MRARPVLLYDDDCRLCRFAVRIVERLDRGERLALLPLQASEAEPLLASLPPGERLATWRLVDADGELAGRGRGAPSALRALGYERTAALLAVVPERALETAYDLVARNRGRLGRLVPNGPGPRRYP